MKKILVIPSWYPDKSDPYSGEFVRNQSLLLSGEFDVRIMYGKLIKSESRLIKLYRSLIFMLSGTLNFKENNADFISPPFVYGFNYFKGLNKLTNSNFNLKIASYLKYFEEKILHDWKPDIIHAHNADFAGIIACAIKEKYSIPYIITDHHHVSFYTDYDFRSKLIRAFSNSVTNCFVSQWQWRTYLLLNSEITGCVIGNPVDSEMFNTGVKKSDSFIISHLSNGDTSKDINTLFRAFQGFFSLVDNSDDIKVRIAGFSEKKITGCKASFGNNSWFDKIEFVPVLAKKEVVDLLQNSSVYVHTSIYESFGLSCIEAISCGIPVVSTNNGGISEYLVDGVNGILCEVKNYNAVGNALYDVYKERVSFNSTTVRGSIKGKFDNPSFVKKMSEIYNDCK